MHFEMHGNSNMEGLVLSDQSHIQWKELSDLFRPVNISTANNLFISMATCYGRYLYKGVDPYKKSPYSGYISASKAVYPSEIIDKFTILFERLFMFGNVVDAYIEMEKEGSDFYYKDSERAFEDSYQMMIDEINESPAKKKELIEEGKTILKQMGLTPPSEKEHEFIFDLVLKNIYKEQKAAFEF